MANEYCESCSKLQEQNAEFVLHGVTSAICASLKSNTGLTAALGHKNCEDLDDIVECLIGQQLQKIDGYDVCDWNEFMNEFMTNLIATLDALLCSDCGQWVQIEKLWIEIGKIWNEINNINNILQGLVSQFWGVDTQYIINQATPGLSVSINRTTGDFVFNWSDWIDSSGSESSRYGTGKVTGTIDFCMAPASNNVATYKITNVYINTITYSKGPAIAPSNPDITIRVPSITGTVVYTKTLTASFTDNINRTIALNLSGTIASGSDTGWINFLDIYNDWEVDDEINLQIKLSNNNQGTVPRCA